MKIALLLLSALTFNFTALAENPNKNEVSLAITELAETVAQKELTAEQLKGIHEHVLEAIALANDNKPNFSILCALQKNGRFYPFDTMTDKVVGDTSYNAGHDRRSQCDVTLPKEGQAVTCYKTANGRYYPCDAKTGKVIGSKTFDAGYVGVEACFEANDL